MRHTGYTQHTHNTHTSPGRNANFTVTTHTTHNTPTTHTQHHNTHEYSPVAINTEDHTSSATVVGDFLVAVGSSEASFAERVGERQSRGSVLGVPSSSDEEQAESAWIVSRPWGRRTGCPTCSFPCASAWRYRVSTTRLILSMGCQR